MRLLEVAGICVAAFVLYVLATAALAVLVDGRRLVPRLLGQLVSERHLTSPGARLAGILSTAALALLSQLPLFGSLVGSPGLAPLEAAVVALELVAATGWSALLVRLYSAGRSRGATIGGDQREPPSRSDDA